LASTDLASAPLPCHHRSHITGQPTSRQRPCLAMVRQLPCACAGLQSGSPSHTAWSRAPRSAKRHLHSSHSTPLAPAPAAPVVPVVGVDRKRGVSNRRFLEGLKTDFQDPGGIRKYTVRGFFCFLSTPTTLFLRAKRCALTISVFIGNP
jgi:hypothetical protein